MPNDITLLGACIHFQAFHTNDVAANPYGFVISNAGTGVIGNQ